MGAAWIGPRRRLGNVLFFLIVLSGNILGEDDRKSEKRKETSVTTGKVKFTGLGTEKLQIHQSSKMAIVNWRHFDFDGQGLPETFMQKGGRALWRVSSGKPTKIPDKDFLKRLYLERSIYFTNPAGYLVDGKLLINIEPKMMSVKSQIIDWNRSEESQSTLEPK